MKLKLSTLAQNIATRMDEKELTAKQLSNISGVTYPSLMPILNGGRDCGISKLVAIADALSCTPNELLKGLYNPNSIQNDTLTTKQLKITAVFISQVKITYCLIQIPSIDKKHQVTKNYALQCGMKPNDFIHEINKTIEESAKALGFTESYTMKNVAVYISAQQYDRPFDKQSIEIALKKEFYTFFLEADYSANYKALVGKQSGVCISLNDGCALTYSTNKGKTIHKLLGYGFPISDIAGNLWLGCEAVKHAVKAAEGIETASPLSDRLLAAYEGNVNALSEATMQAQKETFLLASSTLKELHYKKEKSSQIIEASAKLLLEYIYTIDKKSKAKLPILLAGELAHLYSEYIPKNRITKSTPTLDPKQELLNYGLKSIERYLAKKFDNND
jgi:N-acetylglucosamine kinase-like BadF-type ATPase/DNA-binding Xre family transcriptional regulator